MYSALEDIMHSKNRDSCDFVSAHYSVTSIYKENMFYCTLCDRMYAALEDPMHSKSRYSLHNGCSWKRDALEKWRLLKKGGSFDLVSLFQPLQFRSMLLVLQLERKMKKERGKKRGRKSKRVRGVKSRDVVPSHDTAGLAIRKKETQKEKQKEGENKKKRTQVRDRERESGESVHAWESKSTREKVCVFPSLRCASRWIWE